MWYAFVNGQQQGPFTEDQFNGMIALGSIGLNTQVWKEGQDAWQPLEQVRRNLPAGDSCQICHRSVPGDQLIELNGVRVCAACKPVLLQQMREGVAKFPNDARRRPVMVWVISLFYFVFTPIGVLSLFVIPFLASSSIPMPEAQRHYFQSQNWFDYFLGGLGMVLNLAGAVMLFRLQRQALFCFVGVFGLTLFNFAYQIVFKNWIGALGSQPGGLIGAGIGAAFSIGLVIALVWYVWHLKAKGILR